MRSSILGGFGQIFVFRVKNPCPGGSPGQPLFLRYEIEKRLRAVKPAVLTVATDMKYAPAGTFVP